MSDDLWIVVPNWDKFQHYSRRNPPWIRVYTSLLSHEAFMRLSLRHKGMLFDLWMLYAKHDGQLPASPAYLAHQCGLPSEWELRRWRVAGEWLVSEGVSRVEDTVRQRDLKALEQAEFVQLVASKPLALRGTRDRDRDRKKERKKERAEPAASQPPEAKANAAAYQQHAPRNGMSQSPGPRELPAVVKDWLGR